MSSVPTDDHYADVGFLFEGSEASTLKHFEFQNDTQTVKIALGVVDEDPGAVQSGHYLWPAAISLAKYLLQRSSLKPTAVLELGAGCALASITALQVFPSIQYLVATDHDPGTLDRAERNHEATLEYQGDERLTERLSQKVSVHFSLLSWGDQEEASSLLEQLQAVHPQQRKFDLVLGSDLVYDKDVVTPIMDSVSALMADGGIFLLSQSFLYDDATEMLIDQLCALHGFERIVLKDDLTSEGGVKLQEFHWKIESSSC